MRTKPALVSMVLAAMLMTVAGDLRSQNTPPAPSDVDRAKHILAINLLRAINTAEVEYRAKHGFYAARDVLLTSDEFREKWMAKIESMAKAPVSFGPEILPGWSLRLNVTADGQSFDVLLADTTDTSCGYAVVSNETGVIRQSKAIGCSI